MGYMVTKSKVISSLIWRILERIGTQSIQFIVVIVLARFLGPDQFGLIVLVMVFVVVGRVLVQSGFNTAIIQKKDADIIDFSSVFYFNIFIATLLYIFLYTTAPLIATFFDQKDFIIVLRVLSLILFFGALNSIQIAIIARNLQFKKLFVSSLGAIIISGPVGIVMAYLNFGVWAIVVQQLSNQFVLTLILWIALKWRPQLVFSFERIKNLFSFGWKLLVSDLLDTLYINLQSLIVGKLFSPTTLGFYNRGEQFPNLLVNNINGSIQSVMLPTLSFFQEDRKRLKDIVRRSIVTGTFIIFPVMIGLAVIADPLIEILLTNKWSKVVPYLQIFCAAYALLPIHTANLQAINALGRSDVFLKLGIIKTIVSCIILIICIPFGAHVMALGVILSSVISFFINASPNVKLLNYSIQEQCKDIIPSLILSLIMGGIVYTIHWASLNPIIMLLVQITIGIIIYVGLSIIFKVECFSYLIKSLKEVLANKKTKLIIEKEAN
ncbi:lipopolysaccharide biosynthesis protein [Rummeliibacillus sp. POC4]|nr:lipopolysaccharide biosynthesis protein [Rummeliibacillus sp. POC4]